MFETENDVMNESSTFADDSQFEDQTSNEQLAVEPDFNEDQSGDSGNIQDANTQSEQTIPYDRFAEVNERLRATEENNRKLIELLGRNPGQSQQKSQDSEIDIIDKIVGEDMFISKDQMREILKAQEQKINQVANNTSQSSRENALAQTEILFRQSTPDYDTVIKNIPPKLIQSLVQTYDDPQELVKTAYSIGKSLAPQKPTAQQVVKQAGQSNQSTPKAVVANNIKGGGTGKTVDQYLDEKFNQW